MSKEDIEDAMLLEARIEPNFTKLGNIILLICFNLIAFIFYLQNIKVNYTSYSYIFNMNIF